jgi:hypothetical protein
MLNIEGTNLIFFALEGMKYCEVTFNPSTNVLGACTPKPWNLNNRVRLVDVATHVIAYEFFGSSI